MDEERGFVDQNKMGDAREEVSLVKTFFFPDSGMRDRHLSGT